MSFQLICACATSYNEQDWPKARGGNNDDVRIIVVRIPYDDGWRWYVPLFPVEKANPYMI